MTELYWTPKTLLRRTFAVLTERPSLAVPVAVADICGFAAMHIQHALQWPLLSMILSQRASVFSTAKETASLTPDNMYKALIVAVPLLWGSYLFNICCYAVALVATFQLITGIQDFDLDSLQTRIWRHGRSIIVFSISSLGLCAIGAFAVLPLMLGAINHTRVDGFDAGVLAALIVGIPIAYFRAVPALKLLSKEEFSSGQMRLARLFTVATFVVQTVLVVALHRTASNSSHQRTTVSSLLFREQIVSLLAAIPFVLLFVAFSLLASPNSADQKDDAPSTDSHILDASNPAR